MRKSKQARSDYVIRWIVLSLSVLCSIETVSAHKVSSVSLAASLDTKERSYALTATMDVVPSEEQEVNDQISPEDAAREFAEEFLIVQFDDTDDTPEIAIRIEETSDAETPVELRRKEVVVDMTGEIPPTASEFLLYLDPRCPMAVVMVMIKDERPERRTQVILAGEYSRPVNIEPIVEGSPFPEPEATTMVAPITEPSKSSSPFVAGWSSFFAGSLLPIVLLVTIFFLTTKGRIVFAQFAVLLVIQAIVVALIAWKVCGTVSFAAISLAILIIILAGEALLHRDLKWWRIPLVAFAGLAAGILLVETSPFSETFLQTEAFGILTVILFLLGLEAATIAVAVGFALLFLPLSQFSWYRSVVVRAAAAMVIGYALFVLLDPFL